MDLNSLFDPSSEVAWPDVTCFLLFKWFQNQVQGIIRNEINLEIHEKDACDKIGLAGTTMRDPLGTRFNKDSVFGSSKD